MITLSASGGSVTFEFSGNSTYLNDGQITVPVNSLALIIDESDMATFRKAASNDIFVSANIAEFGMTKAELESWYKANMVGSTGGGGGVTPEEVEEMIDEAVSGKVDTDTYSAYTASTTAALFGLDNKMNDIEPKVNSAWTKGVRDLLWYPTSSGLTLEYNIMSGGTYQFAVQPMDESLRYGENASGVNKYLGVYASGNTYNLLVNKYNNTVGGYRITFPMAYKASKVTLQLNSAYTGQTPTTNAIQAYYYDNNGVNYNPKWNYNSGTDSFTNSTEYTGITLAYDQITKIITLTLDSSYNYIIGVRTAKNFADENDLTNPSYYIGAVTIETNSYKLQEALDNKQDTLTAGSGISIQNDVISVTGKVDTEDLDISGKTLYVGDYRSGSMPYELAKEYPISTKPTKLLVKRTDDGDATNVTAFQLYFSNGTTSGSCILRVSTAVGSGITEAAWQFETPEASLELVNGEVYITFLNGYYLTMFKPATYIGSFVMQIVTDIESGSTPSVVESGIYNALDKMSETLTDVITKSDAAYYKGIGYPSLSYSSSSGITFSSSPVGVGLGINTATTSTLATDVSIGADNGVLGVYTTGATHAVIKNDSVSNNRIYMNGIPSSIKMYWNSSYTGSTTHYIAVSCLVSDGTNGYCQWNWDGSQYVPNSNYINTAVTLSYDSTNQVVTITPSSSSALTSIIYARCNRNIAPATALTQDDCRIGLVTIDTNSYKLQEALDNKVDTSDVTTAVTSGSTDVVTSGGVYAKMGGMTIVKITESDYQSLSVKDPDTLYVVIPDPTNP